MSLLSAWRNHKPRNVSEPATICLQHLPGWGLPYTADAAFAFADVPSSHTPRTKEEQQEK